MERLFNVALKIAHNQGVFTYRLKQACPKKDYVGCRVKVTIKNRITTGVILAEHHQAWDNAATLKDIVEIIDEQPIITPEQITLMKFCAQYYFNPLGLVVHLAVPRSEVKPRMVHSKHNTPEAIELSAEQQKAYESIIKSDHGAFLLQGVTGSGKTMVYMKTALETLKQGKSVLFLVPEISLTPQLVERVEKALGQQAHCIHSNISPAKKRDIIFDLLNNEKQIVIGARSAIFTPLKNLGLIVVDEEHDPSLKQDESPRYHARDLALYRAKNEQARIILGSATPSLESIVNTEKNKLTHLFLENRFGLKRLLPTVEVIDLKKRADDVLLRNKDQSVGQGEKMCILSRPLVDEMSKTFEQEAQVLLFLNQRGYAKFGVCYSCGHTVECPNCSVSLTYYQNRQTMECHQCSYIEKATTTCHNCRNETVHFLGLGTERLEEEVRAIFPTKHIVRLDRDVVRSQERLLTTLSAMHERKADILIGTQMVSKGHDFLHVGLVGVICADNLLSMPDFRAAEKTFQLLTQVAGRAGRGNTMGKALIQTFNPDHPSIKYAKDHNVMDFLTEEKSLRKRFMQPPFTKAALIRFEHKDKGVVETLIARALNIISRHSNITVLGPVPSPIERIKQRFRYQCMALAQESKLLHHALLQVSKDPIIQEISTKKQARFIIDVDPQNMQ